MSYTKQILCISTANYHPFPTRKQNVMNRLTDCHVIYAEPPVTLIAPLKDPSCRARLSAWKGPGEQAMPHIWVYASPAVLPFFNKKRFINEMNQKRLAKFYARLCRQHGFGGDMIVWCYSPSSADIIAPLAKELGIPAAKLWKQTVYDCVDRHSAYPGLIDPELVDAMEEDLCRSCGCVFTTAQGLYDRLRPFNSNTHLLPNGANYGLFARAQDLEPEPHDRLSAPRFGFVGNLQECIDYDAIEAAAKAFPGGRLDFWGKTLPGVDLSRFDKYNNVKFNGLVPQEELPQKIKDFDVCLNCFADNDLSKDVSPLKFFEYLATGKPVVSTAVPLQVRDYADCIYIARDTADFVEKCREALEEPADSPKRAARIAAGRACSWDERVKEMRSILGF